MSNNDEIKRLPALPPSPYPEPTTGLNPFYRSALPSPMAGVDQIKQVTGRYPVPFRRTPPLVPIYAQPTNQVNTTSTVAQQIIEQVNQGSVNATTINGVTVNGSPTGPGDVLTSTSPITADWQSPAQLLEVQQLITSQSPLTNVLAYGNALTGTGKQAYGGTVNGTTTFSIATGYDVFISPDVGKTILICCTTTSGDVNDFWTTIAAVNNSISIILSAATPSNFVRVEEVYWFNPLQDDTLAIQAAINAGGNVYMPHGVYVLSAANTPFSYNDQLRALIGDGPQRTVWLAQNANGSFNSRFIHFLDPNYLTIRDMTFRGPGIDGVFGGNISLDLQNQSNIERCIFKNIELRNTCSSSAALVVNTPILCNFENVKTVLNASTGIWLETPVACTLTNCYCITNVVYGIWIQNGAGVDINGCACESNGISYYIQNSDCVTIHGCDSEAQVHRAPNAPTSFPTVTVASGGSIPVGTYFVKYTWLRQWSGNSEDLESLPSPESSLVTLTTGNQTINFTLPVAPTDAPNVKFANIYLTPTNGASGTEGFEHFQTLNSGTTTSVSLSTFTTPGSSPPTVSAIGHSVVIDGCNYVNVSELSSNGLGESQCFHAWITNSSNMVRIENLHMFGTPTATFDIQVDAGCTNVELVTDASSSLINDNGTGTLIRAGDSFKNLAITGTGTAVTQATGDNSTKIATDAFVQNALASSIPLANGDIFVGNASNVATAVSMSGDTSITNAGAVTVNKLQGTAFTGTTGTASSAVVLATAPTLSSVTITDDSAGANTSFTIQGNTPASVSGNGTNAALALSITGANGGATTGTTGQVGGKGGGVTIVGGKGGSAGTGSTNGNGGTVSISGGLANVGAGTNGTIGYVLLQPTNAGNVGIGTSTPDVYLTLATGTSAGAMQFAIANTATGGSEWYLGSTDNGNASGGGRFLINNANSTGSPAFCINSSKQVGIQNVSPAFALDVTGVVNVSTGFCVGGAAASGHVLRGNGTNFVSAQLAAADLSNGVTGSGAVVLATSPTISNLTVNGSGTALSVTSSAGSYNTQCNTSPMQLNVRPNQGNDAYVSFTENAVADRWIVGIRHSDGTLYFSTGNPGSHTDEITFDSSGNVNLINGVYKNGGTSGVSAGSFSSVTAITSKGGIVTQLTGSSDERLKTNIQPFERGLTEVLQIHPALYQWNEAGQKVTGFKPEDVQPGFIAQDVLKVIPEAIGTEINSEGEFLTLNERAIVAALVNAVKELSSKNEELEKRLNSMERP